MKPEPDRNEGGLHADTKPLLDAADWNEHEHVSEQVQLEAQKLVERAGTPELAKKAIEVIEGRQPAQPPAQSADNRHSSVPAINPDDDPFLKALTSFETALATPVVAGELGPWITNARIACDRVGVLLRSDVQRKHAELFAQILREDAELASRVEKLQEADAQIATFEYEEVHVRLRKLSDRADVADKHEARVSDSLEDTIKQALAFVINARTQETALSTWLMEAFNRDRGEGD